MPVGVRLVSFSIDAAVVVLLVATVAALTRSVALTSLAAVEAVVALVVWEARTGLTVGHAVLHLRTARDDRPWSPGAARELARAGMVGAGALAGGIGAWVVVGSGGLDRTGRGRTWADRAGRTVVVRVAEVQPTGERQIEELPVRQRLSLPGPAASGPPPSMVPGPTIASPVVPGPVAPAPTVHGPVGPAAPRPRRLMIGRPAAPVVPPSAAPPPATAPPPPVPQTVMPPMVMPQPAQPPEVRPPALLGPDATSPPAPTLSSVVPPPAGFAPAGFAPAAAPSPRPDVTVLLVLDTGQRDQLPFGTAAVLGRDPVPQVASDRVVVVRDDEGGLSKSHLRVEHTADGVWLTDLGSTNGTRLLVDGPAVPLAPLARTRIDGVVRVAVGQRVLMVSYMVRGGRP